MDEAEAIEIAQAVRVVVDEVVAQRSEQIYLAMEQMREEFQMTVGVLDGNDHAVIAELQRMKQTAPAVLLSEVEKSWEHFIRVEAERLGLKVLAKKEAAKVVSGKAHGEIVVEETEGG